MATEETTSYKYSCRKCPVRRRCIDLSDNAPTIKSQVRIAFENRTDTGELWAHLQASCLLVKADEEAAKQDSAESLLNRRLRRAKEARQKVQNTPKQGAKPPSSRQNPASLTASPPIRKSIYHPSTMPLSKLPKDIRDPDQLTKHEIQTARVSGKRNWFTLMESKRYISLPTDGELVLGRFDPHFGLPPDVDLSCVFDGVETVSRRHARITAIGGIHLIEEMGGLSGVIVNSQKLQMGFKRRLADGDIVVIGECRLRYEPVPYWISNFNQYDDIIHQLIVNHTGEVIKIQPKAEQIIGRSDRFMAYNADIDLSHLGNIASKVSRRHILLKYDETQKQMSIIDMGSGFGTKVNGKLLMMGENYVLVPGDHLWLGGCVLAYDIQLR